MQAIVNYNRGTKLTLKGIVIGILILMLLIPTLFISNIVSDRKHWQSSVNDEISRKWAKEQTIVGPILIIPYYTGFDKEGKGQGKTFAYLLPNRLNINGNIKSEERKRGIFTTLVYQSALDISGIFTAADLQELNIQKEHLLLSEARLCISISDFVKGLESQPQLKWNNTEKIIDNEIPENGFIRNGLSTAVTLNGGNNDYEFVVKINLRGSSGLFFAPAGKTTTAHLTSDWEYPSFAGNFMPAKSTETKGEGFTADWNILSLNRNISAWKAPSEYDDTSDSFGVNLFQPTSIYSKTDKTIKYAILFIALTFSLCFFLEILQKRSVHPLQYVLVGLALCVFYTLLLSISEYIDFNYAYLIAAVATVSLITLYTKSIFGKWRIAALFGGILTLLYIFMLVLIQLQDTALLVGSIGLFILLAVIMYYSKKIDWSGQAEKEDDKDESTINI